MADKPMASHVVKLAGYDFESAQLSFRDEEQGVAAGLIFPEFNCLEPKRDMYFRITVEQVEKPKNHITLNPAVCEEIIKSKAMQQLCEDANDALAKQTNEAAIGDHRKWRVINPHHVSEN